MPLIVFARAVALSSAFCHTCLCQMLAPKYSICLEQGAGFALAVALSIGLAGGYDCLQSNLYNHALLGILLPLRLVGIAREKNFCYNTFGARGNFALPWQGNGGMRRVGSGCGSFLERR